MTTAAPTEQPRRISLRDIYYYQNYLFYFEKQLVGGVLKSGGFTSKSLNIMASNADVIHLLEVCFVIKFFLEIL